MASSHQACSCSHRNWPTNPIRIRAGGTTLKDAANAPVITQLAGEMLEALTAVKLSETGALTVAWPTAEEYKKFHAFYKALAFARDAKWDEVLDRRELGQP